MIMIFWIFESWIKRATSLRSGVCDPRARSSRSGNVGGSVTFRPTPFASFPLFELAMSRRLNLAMKLAVGEAGRGPLVCGGAREGWEELRGTSSASLKSTSSVKGASVPVLV